MPVAGRPEFFRKTPVYLEFEMAKSTTQIIPCAWMYLGRPSGISSHWLSKVVLTLSAKIPGLTGVEGNGKDPGVSSAIIFFQVAMSFSPAVFFSHCFFSG